MALSVFQTDLVLREGHELTVDETKPSVQEQELNHGGSDTVPCCPPP